MIKKSYAFIARGKCQRSGLGIDIRCVFFDEKHEITELAFFAELEEAVRQSDTLPDCVMVISSKARMAQLARYWDTSPQRGILLARGAKQGVQYVKEYLFYEWDKGQVSQIYPKVAQVPGAGYDLPVDDCLNQGLQRLVETNPVVQIAPAGHLFKHPSGTRNKLFIQARELAKSEVELSFVGHSLCHVTAHLPLKNIETVYIDTMGIYSFARNALEVAGVNARISSFHSYTDINRLTCPSKPYLIVISASTSGGMARKLFDRGFDQKRIVTIIDATSSGRVGTVMVSLDDVDANYKKQVSDGSETEIELVGEHFSSKAKPPRAVTLSEVHKPKSLEQFLKFFGRDGLQGINSAKRRQGNPRAIFLRASKVDPLPEFHAWLESEVRWTVSCAVDFIVHADDKASLALAKRVADLIVDARKGSDAPTLLSYKAMNSKPPIQARGILVVTAVAGDGTLLREISRDLRELIKSEIPRHFLVAVGLPQTDQAWLRLRQFLVRNTTPRNYGFSSWVVLPIGSDGNDNAWERLSSLASGAEINYPKVDGVPASIVEYSLKAFSVSASAAFSGFLPKSDNSPLGLSEGFLFFGGVFGKMAISSVPVATTYLTVAAVLQAARDLKSPVEQLHPTGYESVVLSPENFLRFNDNLLQACLLRAAQPSELDYSASPILSTLMKEFLDKVFQRHEYRYGAAALEFAVALATGRLRLKKDDADELVRNAIERLKGHPSSLLGALLMVGP